MLRQVATPLLVLALSPAACTPATPPLSTLQIAAVDPPPAAVPDRPAPSRRVRAQLPAAPIVWLASERDARERARRTGAPLLVYARAAWSAAALDMERRAWPDPRVLAAARSFVALRLDLTDAEGDAELYAQGYALTAIPTTLVFDAHGHQVAALTGSVDPAALAAALTEASQ